MRLIYFISFLFLSYAFFSCDSGDSAEVLGSAEEAATEPEKKEKIKVVRLPVDINPSTARDYPEDLIALGFPILESAEVENVGSTRIQEEGLLMQLNSYDEQDKIVEYYKKEMTALGWKEGKLNIYKGASKALKFDKDGVTCRLIIISEEGMDYRKIAVNVVKSLDPSKY